MKIHVYAGLKDYFEPEFELGGERANTDELRAVLVKINGDAGQLLAACRFAVEDGFIDKDFKLNSHDTVVIIPPSSGG